MYRGYSSRVHKIGFVHKSSFIWRDIHFIHLMYVMLSLCAVFAWIQTNVGGEYYTGEYDYSTVDGNQPETPTETTGPVTFLKHPLFTTWTGIWIQNYLYFWHLSYQKGLEHHHVENIAMHHWFLSFNIQNPVYIIRFLRELSIKLLGYYKPIFMIVSGGLNPTRVQTARSTPWFPWETASIKQGLDKDRSRKTCHLMNRNQWKISTQMHPLCFPHILYLADPVLMCA